MPRTHRGPSASGVRRSHKSKHDNPPQLHVSYRDQVLRDATRRALSPGSGRPSGAFGPSPVRLRRRVAAVSAPIIQATHHCSPSPPIRHEALPGISNCFSACRTRPNRAGTAANWRPATEEWPHPTRCRIPLSAGKCMSSKQTTPTGCRMGAMWPRAADHRESYRARPIRGRPRPS
jgi:hypothetical protein